jgi:hypothetical protein
MTEAPPQALNRIAGDLRHPLVAVTSVDHFWNPPRRLLAFWNVFSINLLCNYPESADSATVPVWPLTSTMDL